MNTVGKLSVPLLKADLDQANEWFGELYPREQPPEAVERLMTTLGILAMRCERGALRRVHILPSDRFPDNTTDCGHFLESPQTWPGSYDGENYA
ncbi:hypothetical protein [Aggregatilinea lenta]|uniref:hypothetical protein n=1 Tax=Aggregatilinea lenta TaxID=913108 RepID=UPI000E5C5745|nr:hypothetical protein [Aggregatilinea lenta]